MLWRDALWRDNLVETARHVCRLKKFRSSKPNPADRMLSDDEEY